MHTRTLPAPHPLVQRALACTAGTALFGAAAMCGHGTHAMLRGALSAPLLFVGSAALAVPPLFLFAALTGARVGGRALLEATEASLATVSLLLLGLSVPAAFFSVTALRTFAPALFLLTLASVGITGVIALARASFTHENGSHATFTALLWSLFTLALGVKMLFTVWPRVIPGGA